MGIIVGSQVHDSIEWTEKIKQNGSGLNVMENKSSNVNAMV